MTVSAYARHSSKRSKSRERGTGQYKRCKCPLWLRWGKDSKKSAKTRSWDIATKAARKLEQELELAANGIEPPKKPDHITIETAVDLYVPARISLRSSLTPLGRIPKIAAQSSGAAHDRPIHLEERPSCCHVLFQRVSTASFRPCCLIPSGKRSGEDL